MKALYNKDLAAAIDWGWLSEHSLRGMLFSDVDGIMEVGSKFLVVDVKHVNGRGSSRPSNGQRRMYKALAGLDEMTVWIIEEEDDNKIVGVYRIESNGSTRTVAANRAGFIKALREWQKEADGK